MGKIYFGVLVCEREDIQDDDQWAKFFYKSKPIYKSDSDIVFGDFSYDSAEVINEIPLGIKIQSFFNRFHLEKKGSQQYKEAKKLLEDYGLY